MDLKNLLNIQFLDTQVPSINKQGNIDKLQSEAS